MLRQLQGGSADSIDMLMWMGRLALELIGQGGLGYSLDSLDENTRNPFGDAIKRLLCVLLLRDGGRHLLTNTIGPSISPYKFGVCCTRHFTRSRRQLFVGLFLNYFRTRICKR